MRPELIQQGPEPIPRLGDLPARDLGSDASNWNTKQHDNIAGSDSIALKALAVHCLNATPSAGPVARDLKLKYPTNRFFPIP